MATVLDFSAPRSWSVAVPIPPSANRLWLPVPCRNRKGEVKVRLVRTQAYRDWLLVAVPLLRNRLHRPDLPARVRVSIRGGEGWDDDRDPDNAYKPCSDALVHARLLPDDSSRYVHETSVVFTPGMPGVPATCTVGFFQRDFEGMEVACG